MLTKKEIRRVKKYSNLLNLATPSLVMIPFSIFILAILHSVNVVLFDGSNEDALTGTLVMMALSFLFFAFFFYALIRVKIGMNSKAWTNIVSKEIDQVESNTIGNVVSMIGFSSLGYNLRNGTTSGIGGLFAALAIFHHLSLMKQNVQFVARRYKIKTTPKIVLVLLLMMVPILSLSLAFKPIMEKNNQVKIESQRLIIDALTKIEDVFFVEFKEAIVDDVERHYQDIYCVESNIPNTKTSIKVGIGRNGKIVKIRYTIDVDETKSSEDNLNVLQACIQQVNPILLKLGVSFDDEEMKAIIETNGLVVNTEMDADMNMYIKNNFSEGSRYFYHEIHSRRFN